MKKLVLVAALAVMGAVWAEQPAARQPRRMGGGMTPMMDPVARMVMNPRVAEKLNLTDEQKTKLAELGKNSRPAPAVQKKLREAMEKQSTLLQAAPIDEAAVMAAIDEVFEARKAIAKEQTKRVIAIRAILTPEQIEKAREEMKNMGSRGRMGPGNRPGHRAKGDKAASGEKAAEPTSATK